MKNNSNTIAVVVTYNRKELLYECIEALLEQIYSCDILIVDNNSTDGTYEYIKNLILSNPSIKYIRLEENIGGAGGFNYGIKQAVSFGYEYIWIMDDDCIPKRNALQALLAADSELDHNYGWLASEVLWVDHTLCKMNIPKFDRQLHNRYTYPRLKQASFVSILFRRNIVNIVGLPIKEFFIWGDDVEYTRRITQIYKYPAYYVSSSQVIHKMKSNNGSNIAIDGIERLPRYELAFRNEMYLYKQEGIKGVIYYHLKIAFNCMKILFLAKSDRLKRLKSLFIGYKNGLCFNPSVEYADDKS